MKSLLPGEAFAECGPIGEENVTEGAEKHHVKDSGAHKTRKTAEEQMASLSQEKTDLPSNCQLRVTHRGWLMA